MTRALHRLFLLPLGFAFTATFASGCGSDVSSEGDGGASATSTSSTGACTETRGTIRGYVYLFAAPGTSGSAPAAGADVVLHPLSATEDLHGLADANGYFEVEVPPADYILSAEAAGCFVEQPVSLSLAACGILDQDLVLDLCAG